MTIPGNGLEGILADYTTAMKIPVVEGRVATATGAQKAAQIAAALRGRMVTHLITDQATARALLEQG